MLSFWSATSALFAAISLLLVAHAPTASADNSVNPTFPYGSKKVRGVNLGGWLVLEPWITPSLFDNTGNSAIVDEWTFCQLQDRNVARSALQHHWDSWITEQDFADIAAAGLNHVRLPIGFWAWDVSGGEPYIQGQRAYLDKAVRWAGNHGLKLIIDLHGAPGSQNGFDNSGHKVSAPQWQTNEDNVRRTEAVIEKIANQYASKVNVVSMIAPLNEPAGYYSQQLLDTTKRYWKDSYGKIRYANGQQSNTVVLIHDAFQGASYWNGFMPYPEFQGVAVDTHVYQMFSNDEVSRSDRQHIQSACSNAASLAKSQTWAVVGEWTPAMTDCARNLNGRGVGARYDGTRNGSPRVGSCASKTGDGSSFSNSYKQFLRQSFEAQTSSFEAGGIGWIMWTWKTEEAADWSYQAGLDGGWIPHNPTERQYPGICS